MKKLIVVVLLGLSQTIYGQDIENWKQVKKTIVEDLSVMTEHKYVNNKGEEHYFIPKEKSTGYQDFAVYFTYDPKELKKERVNAKKNWFYADRVSGKVIPIMVNGEKVIAAELALFNDNTIVFQYGFSYGPKRIILKRGDNFEYLKLQDKDVSYNYMFRSKDKVMLTGTRDSYGDFYEFKIKNWEIDTIYKRIKLGAFDKKTGCWTVQFEKGGAKVLTPTGKFIDTKEVSFIDDATLSYESNNSLIYYDMMEDKELESYKLKILNDYCKYCPPISLYPVEGENGKLDFLHKFSRERVIKNVDADLAYPFLKGVSYTKVKKDELCGAIDNTGKLVVSFQYNDMKFFSGNYAPVKKSINGSWGVTDIKDSLVIPLRFKEIKNIKIGYADAYIEGIEKIGDIKTTYKIKNGAITETLQNDLKPVATSGVQCPQCVGHGTEWKNVGGEVCWYCSGSSLTGRVNKETSALIYGNGVSIYANVQTKYSAEKCSYCYGRGYTGTKKMGEVQCDLCSGAGTVSQKVSDEYFKKH